MICTKCGGDLETGAHFCGKCGTPVAVVTDNRTNFTPDGIGLHNPRIVSASDRYTKSPPASRRRLILWSGGIGTAGLAFLAYQRSTPVPFWAPLTPTPPASQSPLASRMPLPSRTPQSAQTHTAPTATAAGPKRLIVDAAGSSEYTTIASAILGARPEDIIVLRPGTYKESLRIDRDVQIVGEGGRSKVIVEAAPGQGAVFMFTAGSATLTGLTIRIVGTGTANIGAGAIAVLAGTPVIEDCDLTSSAGSAVYILGAGANPVIRNCTMRNSRDDGVHVQEQGQGTIEKCVISGNTGSGVAITTGGNPTVRDCEIRDNKGVGVMVLEQGQGTIERCVISGNAYAGVQIKRGGNPVVRDCEIRDNKGGGVFVSEQGQGTIERCVISGNAFAGVEIRTGGNPVVRDCEIRDNKQAGVVVTEQAQGTFTGNTLTGNANGAWVIRADAGRVTRTGNRPNE